MQAALLVEKQRSEAALLEAQSIAEDALEIDIASAQRELSELSAELDGKTAVIEEQSAELVEVQCPDVVVG